ncbi:uncharacterized protein, partial [Diadema antillarum]|uniref:uncharacterized protein n=1 Tax=Diadema antillarum TaxID=105358 RepID=UPI003A8AA63E
MAGDVELRSCPVDPSGLSALELHKLAELMGPDDFKKVGLGLGMEDAALRRYVSDRGNYLEASYFMLTDWLKTVPEAQSRDILVITLQKCRLVQLADKVRKGLVDQKFPPLTDKQVAECRRDLEEFYLSQLCKMKIDPLGIDSYVEFEHMFTNLCLLEKQRGSNRKKPLDYEKLLTTKVKGQLPKRLLVEGEGGSGKTTLCAKIAWDWSKGALFQEFDMVVVVPLRDVEQDESIGDITRRYLSESSTVHPRQIDEYILANPAKVFVVFDGLDEFDGDLSNSSKRTIVQILRSDRFKKGTVLVTTRPWKADQIRWNQDLRDAYAFIGVEGFSRENVSTYIRKFFAEDLATADSLIQFIDESDVITENMAPFPIYSAMLCLMWQDGSGEKREMIRKLQTFSQLFKEMFLFLQDHYISKHCKNLTDPLVNEQFQVVDECMIEISKVAFAGLLENKLAFSPAAFSECEEAIELGCKVGVLTQERGIATRRERYDRRKLPMVSKVMFPHKLFQEYLAGMHLASLYDTDPTEYARLLDLVILPKAREFHFMLYFSTSQDQTVGLDILTRMCSNGGQHLGIRKAGDQIKHFIVDTAFECNDQSAAGVVHEKILMGCKELQICQGMSAHTALAYLFIMENHYLEKLELKKSCGRTVSRELAEEICSTTSLNYVKIGEYVPLSFHPDFYSILALDAPSSKVHTFELRGMFLHDQELPSKHLATYLCTAPSLRNVTLCKTQLHDAFFAACVSRVWNCKIENIVIRWLDLSDRESASRNIALFLLFLRALSHVFLRDTELHDSFYSTMRSNAPSCKVIHASDGMVAACDLSKIKSMTASWIRLRDRESASEDLAWCIARLPYLEDVTFCHLQPHDAFYSITVSNVAAWQVQSLTLRYMAMPLRYLLMFLSLPRLKALTLIHVNAEPAQDSIEQGLDADSTTNAEVDLIVDDWTLARWHETGLMRALQKVRRVTLRIFEVVRPN